MFYSADGEFENILKTKIFYSADGPQKPQKYFKSIFYSADEIFENSQKYFKTIFYSADETFETFSKPHFELQTKIHPTLF